MKELSRIYYYLKVENEGTIYNSLLLKVKKHYIDACDLLRFSS
jgi:hypothetical protein